MDYNWNCCCCTFCRLPKVLQALHWHYNHCILLASSSTAYNTAELCSQPHNNHLLEYLCQVLLWLPKVLPQHSGPLDRDDIKVELGSEGWHEGRLATARRPKEQEPWRRREPTAPEDWAVLQRQIHSLTQLWLECKVSRDVGELDLKYSEPPIYGKLVCKNIQRYERKNIGKTLTYEKFLPRMWLW